ncbi:MAG: response regulator transcription factor [Thermodesulfovibrionales bacterium]|nr:response regulator transcription factor [Thermodesulfovibrionales bacterium]
MRVRIILADDHTILREGLCALLAKQRDFQIVAEAGDGRTAVRLTQELLPDVVVMDVNMPDLNGIEATRQIITDNPGIKVIALSMYSEKQFVVEMLKAGAAGYMLKDSAFEELVHAINCIVKDQIYLSPSITTFVLKDYLQQSSKADYTAFSILTDREREVLQLIVEGKTTKEIASILNVSTKTIETHRQQIMKKLNVHSIAELTKYAIREGITSV